MDKDNLSLFRERLAEHFMVAIGSKNSWGKNEIELVFYKAMNKTMGDIIEKESERAKK